MTTQNAGAGKAKETTSPMPVPPRWWCHWQNFKGTNPKRLSIPAADLRGKLVVLTGGNSGIGREASLKFVKWGANIIIGCRQPPSHETHPDVVVEELKENRDSNRSSPRI
ncbi:hypothetical protein DL98DRAFT_230954 [Cadophora sp. DSE1049]|nr:hypothetical protein DL98DRAFT_230954 [Cadophora sp. DSE1049]